MAHESPQMLGRVESTVLLEAPETPGAELLQEEEVEPKVWWRGPRGLMMVTDAFRLDTGAAGCSVVWKNRP